MPTRQQDKEEKDTIKQHLAEKRRQELWLYLGVGIISLDALVTVAAVCYGFITAKPDALGVARTNFPFLLWGAGMIMLPAALVAAVHYAGVGLFGARNAEDEAEWEAALPKRLQRVYRLLKGAPVLVVLLGLIFIGGTLATIDGALTALSRTASALLPYLPHIIGGFAFIVCCICLSAVWLRYQSRKLEAEFAYRREVFERSGIIIVDKKSYALPPASENGQQPALGTAARDVTHALPAGDDDTIDAEVDTSSDKT